MKKGDTGQSKDIASIVKRLRGLLSAIIAAGSSVQNVRGLGNHPKLVIMGVLLVPHIWLILNVKE